MQRSQSCYAAREGGFNTLIIRIHGRSYKHDPVIHSFDIATAEARNKPYEQIC